MMTFLKGLLALPVVAVAVVVLFWVAEVVFALLWALVSVLAIAIPFLVKAGCIICLILGGIYALGKLVSSIFGN